MPKIKIMRFLQAVSKDVTGKDFYELDAETKQRLKEHMLQLIKGMLTTFVKEPAATRIFEEAKKEIEKM